MIVHFKLVSIKEVSTSPEVVYVNQLAPSHKYIVVWLNAFSKSMKLIYEQNMFIKFSSSSSSFFSNILNTHHLL